MRAMRSIDIGVLSKNGSTREGCACITAEVPTECELY